MPRVLGKEAAQQALVQALVQCKDVKDDAEANLFENIVANRIVKRLINIDTELLAAGKPSSGFTALLQAELKGSWGELALTWASVVVLALLENPEVQAAVKKELDPLITKGTLEKSTIAAALLLAKKMRELRKEPVPEAGTASQNRKNNNSLKRVSRSFTKIEIDGATCFWTEASGRRRRQALKEEQAHPPEADHDAAQDCPSPAKVDNTNVRLQTSPQPSGRGGAAASREASHTGRQATQLCAPAQLYANKGSTGEHARKVARKAIHASSSSSSSSSSSRDPCSFQDAAHPRLASNPPSHAQHKEARGEGDLAIKKAEGQKKL